MTNLTGETGGLIMCFLWKKSVATSQEDCANSEVSPPKDLLKVYGVKAQMLGPLIWDHKLVGFISVHYTPSTRHWSHNDIAALDNAKERVMSRLKQAEWLI
jgi:maleate isomerase